MGMQNEKDSIFCSENALAFLEHKAAQKLKHAVCWLNNPCSEMYMLKILEPMIKKFGAVSNGRTYLYQQRLIPLLQQSVDMHFFLWTMKVKQFEFQKYNQTFFLLHEFQ